MSANRRQVAGQHYAASVQHWDYVIEALDGRYLEGNITKYVCRHRKKNGLQDLEKALHYLDKLEELVKEGKIRPLIRVSSFSMATFISDNGLNTSEAFIVKRLAYWCREDHLKMVRKEIHILMNNAREAQTRSDAVKCGVPMQDTTAIEPTSGYVNQG